MIDALDPVVTLQSDGVERTYNKELTGKAEKLKLNNLSDLLLDKKRTANVTLTLTNSLQKVATQALGPRKGAVVALDPRTGAVLAMADYPSFDPNPLAAHDQKVVRDAWIRLTAEPGHPLLPREPLGRHGSRVCHGERDRRPYRIVTPGRDLHGGQSSARSRCLRQRIPASMNGSICPSNTAVGLPVS